MQVDDEEQQLLDAIETLLSVETDEIDEIDVQTILVVLLSTMLDDEVEPPMIMVVQAVDDYEDEGIDLWLIIVTDTKLLLQLQQQIIDDEVDDEYTVLLILLDVQVVNE